MKTKIAVIFAVFGMFFQLANSATIHVKHDASGANNGSSWADAFTSLQSALASASSGDDVWVAAGTYKPTAGSNRSISFEMLSNVEVYGGFAGTETAIEQRFWKRNPTLLSGDLLGNDNGAVFVDEATRSDNSYNVVKFEGVSDSRLDGFTVTRRKCE